MLPCSFSHIFDRLFRVSGLLVAVYSHNLVAIINCDYPSWTCEPLLPGCQERRLIESQVSINYQGVLVADSICSLFEATIRYHPTLAHHSHHQGQIGQGGVRQKAQN